MTEQINEEVEFDFTKKTRHRGRPSLSPEERERRIQLAADGHYIKNRNGILAKSRDKTRQNRPEERLRNAWQHNFDQLSPEGQQRIDDLNLDCRVALAQAIETIGAIGKNKFDANKPAPDQTYRFVADFVAQTGRGNSFSDLSLLASLDAETFEQATADDLNVRLYGRPTKLNGLIVDLFAQHVWQWAQANKSDCDATVYAELEAQFPKPEAQPVPAQPVGYKTQTRAEESAALGHKENVAIQQRLMAERGTE